MVSRRWAKTKGTNAERNLIKMFWDAGDWVAHRMAGSGCSPYPGPDLIAGNGARFLAVEVKTSSDPKRYFPKREIEDLRLFAKKFGSEAWIAIKFSRMEWLFVNIEDLGETVASFTLGIEDAKRKGLTFEQVTKGF